MSEWMLQVETSGRPLSWPCGARHSAARRTSRRTGAPCRPTQNTTSATGNQSSRHWEEGREEEKGKKLDISFFGKSNCCPFLKSYNSQQSVQHAGERCDADSSRNTQTDIVVKHFFWRAAEWTINVEPEHTQIKKNKRPFLEKDHWHTKTAVMQTHNIDSRLKNWRSYCIRN